MRNRDARVAGFLYLLSIIVGFLVLRILPDRLIKTGDAAATTHNIAALLLVTDRSLLSAFSVAQRDAMVMLFLRLHNYGILSSLVFGGLWLIPFGILVASLEKLRMTTQGVGVFEAMHQC